MKPSIALAAVAAAMALIAGPAQAAQSDIKVSPKEIAFGTRAVGKTYFDGVKITNTSGSDVLLLVEGGLPDDFGFGLLPGSTCPVLNPEVMADGASCRAVVRYTPSEFFVGDEQTGGLTVTTTDPETGAVVNVTSIPVSGTGKN
jgi:hypothetical protein